MNNLSFWKTWKPAEQFLYFFILFFCTLAFGWYAYAWYTGSADVIETVVESEIHQKKIVSDRFDYQLFDIPLDADTYYLTHFFRGSGMTVNLTANYIYTFFLTLSFVLLLTVSTFLSRTWYVVLMSMFVLYLVSVNLELLEFFGKTDRTLLVIFLVSYLPISYYFHSIENKISLLLRFIIFSVITSILAGLIYNYAEVENPAMFFNGFGLTVPLVLSCVFIAINSHEIIHGIFYLVSEASTSSSKNTSLHFFALSLFYILNLIYVFLYNIQSVDWEILYFSPFFLLILTLVLGIWGFKKREVLYQSIGEFAPYGAIFYLAMTMLTISTCAYIFATANDPLIEVFEDIITFTHLSFGLSFMLYVMANFYDYLAENKKAHRVVYMPHRLGFGLVYIMGAVVIGVLIMKTSNFTYRQAIAGYHNTIGDLYQVEKDTLLMQKYYQNSLGYEYRNHKANYSMASYLMNQNANKESLMYFENALLKQPVEESYLTLARIYDRNEQYFRSVNKLREGLEKYPKSGKLATNLALLYNRMQLPDSVFIYFEMARQNLKNDEKHIADANFYSFWIKDKSGIELDSILAMMGKSEDIRTLNNEIAFRTKERNLFNQKLDFTYLPDSVLETINLTYLYNYSLNQAPKRRDTSLLKYLEHYKNVPENQDNGFDSYLQLAQFFTFYHTHDYLNAYQTIYYLTRYESKINEYYTRILGSILLQHQQFEQAGEAFKKSYLQGNISAGIYAGLAFSELKNRSKALEIWQELTEKGDSTNQKIARRMLSVLHPDSLSNIQPQNLKAEDLYYYVHFHQATISADKFDLLFQKFTNNKLKYKILLDRISFFIKTNKLEEASNLHQKYTIPTNLPESLQDDFLFADLQLSYAQSDLKTLKQKISKVKFEREKFGYKTFYKAWTSSADSKTDKSEKLFQQALKELPFEPEVAIQYANFCNTRLGDEEKAYQILLKNLENYSESRFQPSKLLKAYTMQSARMGYDSYVDDTLEELKLVLETTDFEGFKSEIKKIQAENIDNLDNF